MKKKAEFLTEINPNDSHPCALNVTENEIIKTAGSTIKTKNELHLMKKPDIRKPKQGTVQMSFWQRINNEIFGNFQNLKDKKKEIKQYRYPLKVFLYMIKIE